MGQKKLTCKHSNTLFSSTSLQIFGKGNRHLGHVPLLLNTRKQTAESRVLIKSHDKIRSVKRLVKVSKELIV